MLVGDSGSGSQRIDLSGGALQIAQNNQCVLSGSGSAISSVGERLTVKLNLHFKPSFSGERLVFAHVEDDIGSGTGLVQRGTWTVR
jgi:hypothetical protein